MALLISLTEDTGVSSTDHITSKAALTLSALDAGSTRNFVVVKDGVAGTGSATYAAPSVSGVYTVIVTDTDAKGVTTTATITFTLDAQAPAAPVLALLNDTGSVKTDLITRDGKLIFTGAEPGARSSSSWCRKARARGVWTSTLPTFTADGTYTVIVRQTDAAGNAGTASSNFTFTLDTAAPGKPLRGADQRQGRRRQSLP